MTEPDPMAPKPAKIRHRSLKILRLLSVLRGQTMLDVLDELILEAGSKAGAALREEMDRQLEGLRQVVADRKQVAAEPAPADPPAPPPPDGEQPRRKRGRPRKYPQEGE